MYVSGDLWRGDCTLVGGVCVCVSLTACVCMCVRVCSTSPLDND